MSGWPEVPPPLPRGERLVPEVRETYQVERRASFRDNLALVFHALREMREGEKGGGTTIVNAPSFHLENHFTPTFTVRGGRSGRPVVLNQGGRSRGGNFLLGLAVVLFVVFFIL